nr:MAG TPA: Pectate lyase [Caudoviricetes sp.]
MVNNDSNFKSIELLRCWCMKSLPTVFSDALSYNQQVCLLTKAINDMANTINGLPDYIIELVKELLNQLNLETIVKEVLADLYFLNVKNPPNNMTPAVGDGVTDDTAAIQAMIQYLTGRKAYLFFPAGIYSVTGLNVNTNMSLVGLDRYQTTLQLRAGSNKDLLIGDLGSCTINGITLDANMPGQTQNCSVFDGNVGNMLISNVIFKNGYNVLNVDVDGLVQMDNIVFDGVQGNGLSIGGDRAVINDIQFVNNSTLNAGTLITVSGNNSMITGLLNTGGCTTGLSVSGNNNVIIGVIKGATTPIINTGTDNYINIVGSVHTVIDGAYTHTMYGDYTASMHSKSETMIGDNTIIVGGNNLKTISGTNTISSGNKTETITGSSSKTVTTNDTEKITGTKEIQADNIFLNPANPLKYGEVKTDTNIKYVDMIDKNNQPYKLLSDITIPKPVTPIVLYPVTLGITSPETYSAQGFTMDDTFFYQAFTNTAKDNAYLRKISIADNTFTDTNLNLNSNANSLAVDDNYLYVLTTKTKETNKMYTLDKSTLAIVSEITPSVYLSGISVDKVTGKLYGVSYDTNGIYEINNGATTLIQSFTPKYNPSNQGLGVYNGVAYIPFSFPKMCYKVNLETGITEPLYLPDNNFITYIIETEDICFDSVGEMYLSSAMYTIDGYYTISTTKNTAFALSELVTVEVKKSSNILPTGDSLAPFPDIQTALWYVKLNNNPTIRTINVASGNYAGFQAYGVHVQVIGASGVNITSQCVIRNSIITLENMTMEGLTNLYNVAIEDSVTYINNVVVNNLTGIAILVDKGSYVSEFNSSYEGTHFGCRYSTVITNNYNQVVKSTAGPNIVYPGIYLSGKSGTTLEWDLTTVFGSTTWTVQPRLCYHINIGNILYQIARSGTGSFDAGGNTITFNATDTKLTLTATSSVTVNSIFCS